MPRYEKRLVSYTLLSIGKCCVPAVKTEPKFGGMCYNMGGTANPAKGGDIFWLDVITQYTPEIVWIDEAIVIFSVMVSLSSMLFPTQIYKSK